MPIFICFLQKLIFFTFQGDLGDLHFQKKSQLFVFSMSLLPPSGIKKKTFSALVCKILVIFKSFNRKEEYFFVFEWLFYTFQNVKKWQNNPFSGGSKYIKVSQITIFQNLCTKFRVKTQWWELFLFQLFNIKVLSEDFNFQKT